MDGCILDGGMDGMDGYSTVGTDMYGGTSGNVGKKNNTVCLKCTSMASNISK